MLVASIEAIRILNGGMRLTPFFVTAWTIIALNFFGAAAMALGFGTRNFVAIEAAWSVPLFLHVSLALAFFFIGAFVVHPTRVAPIVFKAPDRDAFFQRFDACIWLLIFLSAAVLAIYWYSLPVNPFRQILEGDARSPLLLRSLADYGSSDFFRRLSRWTRGILVFTTWCVATRAALSKRGGDVVIATVMFLMTTAFFLIHLHKAPVLIFALLTALLVMEALGRRIGIRQFVKIGVAGLAIIVLAYTFLMGRSASTLDLVEQGLERMFVGQIYPGLMYLDAFPKNFPFQYGNALPNPGGLLPFTPFDPSISLWLIYFADDPGVRGLVGSLPAFFPFEGYVNFGLFGLCVWSFFGGVITLALSRLSEALAEPRIGIPIRMLLTLEMQKLAMTTLTSVIFSVESIAMIGLTLGIVAVCQFAERIERGRAWEAGSANGGA